MKALINEIREYFNQEKKLEKTLERVQLADSLASEFEDEKDFVKQAKLLNERYDYQEKQLDKFVKIVCEAYKITPLYFIGCVNQYTEVLSYDNK